MRKYTVVYSSKTKRSIIAFRDDDDPNDLLYISTQYGDFEGINTAKEIVSAFNFREQHLEDKNRANGM